MEGNIFGYRYIDRVREGEGEQWEKEEDGEQRKEKQTRGETSR